ncbi:hypothetical protein [Variovorax terrae]|uniref:Uncharacterized protein n=1 Tax=Variovorax terrae TaxID=2923278 RepID=A0A9X2AN21_9BURK|nr:hypothetical protein [Variovorax terrae]MCJ0763969.1 hypothetical protein [Variovorax terrae]
MMLRDRPYAVFFCLAVLFFLATTFGADVLARTSVGDDSLAQAMQAHARQAVAEPLGTAMLLLPFLLLGWMSASLARKKGVDRGLVVFLFGALLLGLAYFFAYHDAQIHLKQQMWTAAALSIGLLPYQCVPLLAICLGFRWWVARRKGDGAPA